MKRTLFLTVSLILVAFYLNALSAALEESQVERGLRRDISLLNLINGLYLSEDQINEFLVLLREVEEEREECQDKLDGEQRKLERDLIKLKVAFARGRRISRGTKSKIAERYQEIRRIRSLHNQKLWEMTEKVMELLRGNELEIVENFSSCLIPPKDLRSPIRVGQVSGDTSRATELLGRIRDVPQHKLEGEREKIVEAVVEIVAGKKQLSPEEREMKEEMAAEYIEEVRNLSDVDFQLRKVELSRRIASQQEATGQEKERIRKWKVRHFLLDVRLIPLLTKSAELSAGERAGLAERVKQLETDLTRLTLIRRLHLMDGQIGELIAKLEEAKVEMEEYAAENCHWEESLCPAFTDLRKELLRGQDVPREVEGRAAQVNHQVYQFRKKSLNKLMEMEEEIKELLTGDQLILVENFSPQQIITQDEPGIVLKSQREAEKLLSRTREITSKHAFEKRVEKLLDRYVKKLSSIYRESLPCKKWEWIEEEIAGLRERFLKVLYKARALSPGEFSKRRAELLRELLPRLGEERWTEKRGLGKIGEYLLDPKVIPLLKKEL